MLTIGSLFSGIGGVDLGLEWAGLGPVLWQVEIDPFCRSVLAKHWPEVERFEDVQAVSAAELVPVDLICGGFPCQNVSSAGDRSGLTGERSGLWYQFARIVGELRPGWVVVENVSSGATLWFDAVVGDLEQLGYACLPVPLSALAVGAPHRRDRLFIIAHTDRDWQSARAVHAEVASASAPTADADGNGLRQECAGRAVTSGSAAANTDGARREGSGPEAHPRRPGSAEDPWGTPVPQLLRMADGLSARLDRTRPRIAALGNSVVPQCSEVIGWVIRELLAGR